MKGDREFFASDSGSPQDGDGSWVGGPRLFASLWRYRFVIVAVAAVCAVAGYALSLAFAPKYEADASLYLNDPGSPSVLSLNGTTQSGDHALFMATQAGFAGSDAVFARALTILQRGGTPDDLRRSVAVAPSADLASLQIKATASSPADAAAEANAVGTAYQQVAAEKMVQDSKDAITRILAVDAQRETELDSLKAQAASATGTAAAAIERKALHVADLIGSLQVHEDDIAAQAALYGSGVESFEKAEVPTASSAPKASLLAMFGAVLGLVVAAGWAWWAAGRHRRVEADSDAGAILGVPLMGEAPVLVTTPPDRLDPAGAEAYHVVLASLEHALSRIGGKAVAVASATPGDGKTLTVLNLALAARREGRKVLLVTPTNAPAGCPGCVATARTSTSSASPPAAATPLRSPGTGRCCRSVRPSGTVTTRPCSSDPAPSASCSPPRGSRPTSSSSTPRPCSGSPRRSPSPNRPTASSMVVNHGTSLDCLRRAKERLAFTHTPLLGYLLNRGPARSRYPYPADDHAADGPDGAGRGLRRLLPRPGRREAPDRVVTR